MKRFAVGFVVFIGLYSAIVWWSRLDGHSAHDSVHVGMTVEEALDQTRTSFNTAATAIHPPEKLPAGEVNFHIRQDEEGRFVRREGEPVPAVEQMKKIGGEWRLAFHFSAVPRRVGFEAVIGADGKVREVTGLAMAE